MDDPEASILLLLITSAAPSLAYVIFNIVTLLILLMLSALISGSEVAFFSLSPEEVQLCKNQSNGGYDKIYLLLEQPKKLLATILILNNLVNVAIVTISTFFTWTVLNLESPKGTAIAILTVVITLIIVFFGEVTPKVYASNNRISFAKKMAPFLQVMQWVLRPLSWFLLEMSNVIDKRVQTKGYDISVDELEHALDMTDTEASEDEKEILRGILNFGSLSVKQIMTSRMDITAIDLELDFHELMDKINKTGFSRLPVYEETIDRIEGILYIKDLLPFLDKDETFEWQKLLRQSFFVPENKKVDRLLKDFQNKRVHMAIVVDEHGGVQGLVTLEDIIEEIVGEINDEFDDEPIAHQKLDNYTYIFEGKVSINDFSKVLEEDPDQFDEWKGESESLGGMLLEQLGKIPRAGEKIVLGKFKFTAIAVDNKRIKKVKVNINADFKAHGDKFTD